VVNAFIEDDVAVKAVHLVFGTKVERDRFAGSACCRRRGPCGTSTRSSAPGWPSRGRDARKCRARAIDFRWQVPSENGLRSRPCCGQSDLPSEELLQVDGGYRCRSARRHRSTSRRSAARTNTARRSRRRRRSLDFTPYPHVLVGIEYGSLLQVRTKGVELSGRWSPVWRWRRRGLLLGASRVPGARPCESG
jgi:hypothetical protein